MTTTHASTAAPKPVETANKPAQANARANADKPAAADLFASLLNLVSDTHLAPDAAAPTLVETPAADKAEPDDPTDNPLAALLAWATPATAAAAAAPAATGVETATPAATSGQTALPDPGLPAHDPADTGVVDISGMLPVVDDTGIDPEALPAPAGPASAAARPAFATPASRPAFASRADAALPSSAPAMVWQRGAATGTDALQQQFASQSIQHALSMPSTHVRSTVALDERFTMATAHATQAGTPREAGFEFTLPANGGLRAGTADAGPAIASPTLSEGSALGDATGGSTGDAMPGEQSGQAHDGTHAEREAEGPTVSHWGTQHLRHASLRVGESGADAIDIQLSMKGQEVQVAFQSDNAEARASLREGASDALAELMQRSGIQLGQVSVGAQGQQHGGNAPHTPTVSRGEIAARGEASAPPAVKAAASPRADGSQPLDLFGEVRMHCSSFSVWWKHATRGVNRLSDLPGMAAWADSHAAGPLFDALSGT